MTTDLEIVRSRVATTDLEEVRDLFETAWANGLTVEPSPDAPFGFEQVAASDGTMSVFTMRFAGRLSATMDGARDVVFADVAEGRYDWRSRGRHGDQERPLVLPAGHELAVEFDSVCSTAITVDAPTAARWFSRYGGLPPAAPLLQRAGAGSDAVRHAIRFTAQVMPSAAFASELVRASLLDVLLSVTAHHLLPDGAAGGAQRRSVPAALARAEQYFRDHAAEPVSVADAAEAARLSVRGLQDQFQRWLHVSPGRYLQNLRLEGVRADLVAARTDGRPAQVAAVARRWGFAHAGRFSSTYAAAFGELPSVTLRG